MDSTDFLEWALENGVQNFGVDIRNCSEGGKGLFTTKDFRENETLICVPVKIIITAGSVAEMPDYCDVFKRHRLKPFEALVYFFLLEKEQDSKWAPYLKMLPKSFSTPASLHPNLKPEDFPLCSRNQWCLQKNELKTMYEKFVTILGNDAILNHFLWAWHVVNTRCIYLDNKLHPLIDNSEGDSLGAVPLIDMLNHRNDSQCRAVTDSELNVYKVVVTRHIRQGEQIFICYGSHTNGSLWIEYGFFLNDNICNKVEVSLEHFMELAYAAGFMFSNLHRKTILQANFPWKHWAKLIYEETEAVTENDALTIVQLLYDEVIEDGKKSPEETRWLWDEQSALLHTLLNTN